MPFFRVRRALWPFGFYPHHFFSPFESVFRNFQCAMRPACGGPPWYSAGDLIVLPVSLLPSAVLVLVVQTEGQLLTSIAAVENDAFTAFDAGTDTAKTALSGRSSTLVTHNMRCLRAGGLHRSAWTIAACCCQIRCVGRSLGWKIRGVSVQRDSRWRCNWNGMNCLAEGREPRMLV